MVLDRSYEEVIVDNLLLLYLISKSGRLGRTKLQKLVYLVECKLGKKGLKTFNYNFYRWNIGPFTQQIFQDGEALVDNNIISDVSTKPTERGIDILKQCDKIFENNKQILKEIDKIIYKYDKLPLEKIKDAVYESKVNINGKLLKVKDVPMGEDLKVKISEDKAVNEFRIAKEWLETLDILLDEEFSNSIHEAMGDAKKHRAYRYDEVFLDV